MLKIQGRRTPRGTRVTYEYNNHGEVILDNVGTHSPTGFEWGYGGSGPADLAESILHLCVGIGFLPPRARTHLTRFKWDIIAPLGPQWVITEEAIKEWWESL